MSNRPRRKWVWVLLILILLLLGVLIVRCRHSPEPPPETDFAAAPEPTPAVAEPGAPAEPSVAEEEALTAATLQPPAEVEAGALFAVSWTGPNNARDYLTIVRRDAPDGTYDLYRDVRHGNPLEMTAPIDAGDYEVRYMTFQSRQVLGRAPLRVVATNASLTAPEEAVAGTRIPVEWKGPNHDGDYITIVPAGTRDGQYRNYTYTKHGSPVEVTALIDAGPAELRYMTGQGARVLARRPITIVAAPVSLSAADDVIAGSPLTVEWSGPNNPGDYITIVPASLPDGQYRNYSDTRKGSPLTVKAPIEPGPAELRYQTAQGARVLARRPVLVRAAEITLNAPAEVPAGSRIEVTWTGPNNDGDYITIVPAGTPDGRYQNYGETRKGSPLAITAPKEPGECELRYMSGQGAKVLSRRAVRVVAP